MPLRSKAPAAHGRPSPYRHPPADRVPSAAWLAAQAAFSAPPTSTSEPAEPAVVVVRKARVVPLPAASSAPADARPTSPPLADKPARVFRVQAEAEVEASEPLPAAEPRRRLPRKRRLDVDKRPGPVLHIVQAEVAPPATPTPREQRAALLALVARLDAVLDDIRRARAFRCLA